MGRRNKRARIDGGGEGGGEDDGVGGALPSGEFTVVREGAVACVVASQHAKLPGSTPGLARTIPPIPSPNYYASSLHPSSFSLHPKP
jgi:hypothetical protein